MLVRLTAPLKGTGPHILTFAGPRESVPLLAKAGGLQARHVAVDKQCWLRLLNHPPAAQGCLQLCWLACVPRLTAGMQLLANGHALLLLLQGRSLRR